MRADWDRIWKRTVASGRMRERCGGSGGDDSSDVPVEQREATAVKHVASLALDGDGPWHSESLPFAE